MERLVLKAMQATYCHIKNGRMRLSMIVDAYNFQNPRSMQMDHCKIMGHAIRMLGFTVKPGANGKAVVVWDEKLYQFLLKREEM